MPSTTSSLTLSFGDVNFTLEPQSSSSEISFVNNKNSDEVMLNLSNFSGSLLVSLCGQKLQMKRIIEEEPNSPPVAVVPKNNPGQQQLKFSVTSNVKKNIENIGIGLEESAINMATPSMKNSSAGSKVPRKKVLGDDYPSSPDPVQETQIDSPRRKKAKINDVSDNLNLGQSSDDDDDDESTQNGETITDGDDTSISSDTMVTSIIEVDTSPTLVVRECKSHPAPSPRWGHSSTLIDSDRLFIYGGQSETGTLQDLFVYSMATNKWSKPVNCEGLPRQWHTATYLPERQLLISFGGEAPNKKGKISTTDQVMVLDTELMLWYPPSVSGQIPSGRSGHTANLLPNTNDLLIFGGVKGRKWTNSVALLDISRWKWSVLKIVGDGPRPRSYHSATPILKSSHKCWLVIFGGNDSVKSYNTVHVLETNNNIWTWIHPMCSGDLPPPRTGHCATLLDDQSTIMIYGGWDPNTDDEDIEDIILKDVYLLDTTTWTWTKVKNDVGSRRVGHTSLLSGSDVLVFGGRTPGGFTNEFLTLEGPKAENELSA